jgi:hypothetical protein
MNRFNLINTIISNFIEFIIAAQTSNLSPSKVPTRTFENIQNHHLNK